MAGGRKLKRLPARPSNATQKHASRNPDDRVGRGETYRTWILLATIRQARGNQEGADQAFAAARQAVDQLVTDYPDFPHDDWRTAAHGSDSASFQKYVRRELVKSRIDVLQPLVQKGKEGMLLELARELKSEGRLAEAEQLLHALVPLVGTYCAETSDYHWDHANYAALKNELIRSLIEEDKFEEAQQILDKYDHGLGADFAAQAYWHNSRDESELALVAYNQALERKPGEARFFRFRGELLLKMGRFVEAAADFTAALKVRPSQWFLHKRRAAANFALGSFAEALSDLDAALEKEPSDLSTIAWVSPDQVAKCASREFRQGMRQLADRGVELNERSAESLAAAGSTPARVG